MPLLKESLSEGLFESLETKDTGEDRPKAVIEKKMVSKAVAKVTAEESGSSEPDDDEAVEVSSDEAELTPGSPSSPESSPSTPATTVVPAVVAKPLRASRPYGYSQGYGHDRPVYADADDTDASDDEDSPTTTPTTTINNINVVSAVKNDDPNTTKTTTTNNVVNDNGNNTTTTTNNDDSSPADDDDQYNDSDSIMSELEIREDERVRSTVQRAHGHLSRLGRAEQLQQRSAGKLPGGAINNKLRLLHRASRFDDYNHHNHNYTQRSFSLNFDGSSDHPSAQPCVVELEFPTGDLDAADKFRVWGFNSGRRVYKLESKYTPILRRNVLKTAVGLSYVDIEGLCPPRIVTIPAEADKTCDKTADKTVDSSTDSHEVSEASETAKPVESSKPADSTESAAAVPLSDTAAADRWSTLDIGLPGEPAAQISTPTMAWTTWTITHDETVDAAPTSPTPPQPAWSSSVPVVDAEKPAETKTTIPPALVPTLEVNGMFAIRPSALGGLGCFALRDITRGEHLLVEKPLVRSSMMHLLSNLQALTPDEKSQFFALTGHHPDPRASRVEQIWTANTFVAGELDALFLVASRFNHACSPSPAQNVGYRYDRRQNVLTMTAVARIRKGAELLISYGKSRRMLLERFGFWCMCSACAGEDVDADGVPQALTKDMYNRIW